MKALSVIELASLYGMNRQSIYKRISKGDLSKNSDGKIDLSEAIRVFGEPSKRSNKGVTLQSQVVQKSAEVDILKQQVDMLQKQLELSQEREKFQRDQLQAKDGQIESLQRLLGAPKPQPQAEQVQESKFELNQTAPQFMPEPKPSVEESHSKPEKRHSFFGRVIRAVFE